MDVYLHVYDVTSAESDFVNNSILRFNKVFTNDFMKLGGIFHGAIQVSDCVELVTAYYRVLQPEATALTRSENIIE